MNNPRGILFASLVLFISVNALPTYLYNRDTEIFELSVIHLNDFHARYEETNEKSGRCVKNSTCIGGLGRVKTVINDILKEKPHSLVLNAGDNYQGTLYYSLYKYNITSHFMNTIPFDAMTLGNHEFDDGIDGIVPFLKQINFPIVLSNVNDTLEPRIQGLYNKSVVVERQGKKIGVIGVLIHTCPEISDTENLIFLDESESVNAEAERLVREEGVFTNIVLSHSGYDIEKFIAQRSKNRIGLIVGGHSHTFLYTGDNPPGPDKPEGPYPTIIKNEEGKTVLVTQASAFTKYLGNITVFYDKDGYVKNWSGAPIFLEHNITQDPEYLVELKPYTDGVNRIGKTVLGSTLVRLQMEDCWKGECLLGNFVTDAMVYAYINKPQQKGWSKASIALMNSGAFRASIAKGNITYDDIITTQPFGNDLYLGDVSGKDLRDIFEFSATPYFYTGAYVTIDLLQVSGVKVVIDLKKPIGSRITTLRVRCADCDVPIYEEVVPEKNYKVIVPTFLLNGGDGFSIIPERLKNVQQGSFDMDAFKNYLDNRSPLFEEIGDRTIILGTDKKLRKISFNQ